jgi:hypothetical protein
MVEAGITKRGRALVRVLVAATSLLVIAAGLSAMGAGAARQSTPRSVTFHLVEKQVGSNFIDNPPRQGFSGPPLMGDQFVFTSDVQTRSGAHAGFLDATCMVSRGGNHGTGPCYGFYSFKGGQLMGIAALSFTSPVTRVAIVGGTGVYRGVTGTVVSVSRGQNSPYTDDTFRLTIP